MITITNNNIYGGDFSFQNHFNMITNIIYLFYKCTKNT